MIILYKFFFKKKVLDIEYFHIFIFRGKINLNIKFYIIETPTSNLTIK